MYKWTNVFHRIDIFIGDFSKPAKGQFFQNVAKYINFTPKMIQPGSTEVSNEEGYGKV